MDLSSEVFAQCAWPIVHAEQLSFFSEERDGTRQTVPLWYICTVLSSLVWESLSFQGRNDAVFATMAGEYFLISPNA